MKHQAIIGFLLISLFLTLSGCGGSGSGDGEADDGSSSLLMESLVFQASLNNALDEDAEGTIEDTEILVIVPEGTIVTALRASFAHNGEFVTVNGFEQISGATKNNFTNPVNYVIIGSDGGTVTYTVTLVYPSEAYLHVEGVTPEDGDSGLSLYTSLDIQFDSAALEDSLGEDSVVLLSGSGDRIYGKIINDTEGNQLFFVPYKPLVENTAYTVTISDEVGNSYDRGMPEEYAFGFTTGNYPTETVGDIRVFANYESGYIRKDLDVTFTTEETGSTTIQTGWSKDLSATAPEEWADGAVFDFETVDGYGTVKLFARVVVDGSPIGDNFSFTYKLVDAFPPVSEEGHCEGFDVDDDIFVAGPSDVDGVQGGEVDGQWKGIGFVMGNGGVFTYTFDTAITDGPGYDFAVGENAFRVTTSGLIFAELFYVEVSSNGTDYLRFDNVSLTTNSAAYLSMDPGDVYGLGSFQLSMYGYHFRQPYDLAWLRNKKEALEGTVNLSAITHIKYIDIPGTDFEDTEHGYSPLYDSFGNIIRDAYLTYESGGADVYQPGVINQAE